MTLPVTGARRNLTLSVAAHQTGRVVAVPGCRQWPSATTLLELDGGRPRRHLGSKGSFSTNTHFPNSSGVSTHKGALGQHQEIGSARGLTQWLTHGQQGAVTFLCGEFQLFSITSSKSKPGKLPWKCLHIFNTNNEVFSTLLVQLVVLK